MPERTAAIAIRTAGEADVPALITYVAALRAERLATLFRYDGVPTVAEELAFIREFVGGNAAFFVALDGERIVGNLGLSPHERRQTAHGAQLGISVLAPWRGQGVGSRLLDTGIAWARRRRLRRLELEVWSNNPGARRLYERKGFVIEGVRRGAVEVDGAYVDSILMARMFEE